MFEGWDFVPRHQYKKDCQNLEGRGRLAQEAGVDLGVISGEEHDKKTHQDDDIPGDDDDHEPAGDYFDDGEGDETGEEEQFVGDGVEISTQFGPLVSQARDKTIQSICNSCNRKSKKRPIEMFVDDEEDEQGNQEDSY